MGSTGLSGVRPTGRGAGATSALASCRCHASGSDWQPATSPGRTVVGILPASANPGAARRPDRTGHGRLLAAQWHPDELLAGAAIGPVYRFSVTDIPNNPDVEIFPTVEVIDRLYPPPGLALRYPIPIELTQEELEMAAGGAFVTRVIYVEDPHQALPVNQHRDGEQPWFEAAPGDDPLVAADRLGRPVAILRIGGRVPNAAGEPGDWPQVRAAADDV